MTKRNFTKMATDALEVAVARVWAEHRRSQIPVAVWRGGQVHLVTPKSRVKPTAPAGRKSSRG